MFPRRRYRVGKISFFLPRLGSLHFLQAFLHRVGTSPQPLPPLSHALYQRRRKKTAKKRDEKGRDNKERVKHRRKRDGKRATAHALPSSPTTPLSFSCFLLFLPTFFSSIPVYLFSCAQVFFFRPLLSLQFPCICFR